MSVSVCVCKGDVYCCSVCVGERMGGWLYYSV